MSDVWETEPVVLIVLAYFEPRELAVLESVNSFFRQIITKTSWRALYLNSYASLPHVKFFENNRNAIGKSLQQCECPPRTPTLSKKKFHLLNSYVVPSEIPVPRNPKLALRSYHVVYTKSISMTKGMEIFTSEKPKLTNISTSFTLLATHSQTSVIIYDYLANEQVGETLTIPCDEIVNIKLVYSPTEHVSAMKRLLTKFDRTANDLARIAVFQLFVLSRTNGRYECSRYNIYDCDTEKVFEIVPKCGELVVQNLIPKSLENEKFSCIDFEPESGLLVISGDSSLLIKNDQVIGIISEKDLPKVTTHKSLIKDVRRCQITYCTPESNSCSMYPNTKKYTADVLSLVLVSLITTNIYRLDMVTEGKSVTIGISENGTEQVDCEGRRATCCAVSPSGRYIIHSFCYTIGSENVFNGYDDACQAIRVYDTLTRDEKIKFHDGYLTTVDQVTINESAGLALAAHDFDRNKEDYYIRICTKDRTDRVDLSMLMSPMPEETFSIHSSMEGYVFIGGLVKRGTNLKYEVTKLQKQFTGWNTF